MVFLKDDQSLLGYNRYVRVAKYPNMMVSVVLLARRHLKWEKELQMNHYRFLEQNLQRILKNCRECLLEIFWKDNRNGRKDFANASDYEETWNDSESITATPEWKMKQP